MANRQVVGFCRVCRHPQEKADVRVGHGLNVECARCGTYRISDTCIAILGEENNPDRLLNTDEKLASVGHWIQSRQDAKEPPHLMSEIVTKLAAKPYFPDIHHQRENLIRLIGVTSGGPGARVTIEEYIHQFAVGCSKPSAIGALVDHLQDERLLQYKGHPSRYSGTSMFDARLTVAGWIEFEDLARGKTSGRTAFMAMPFNKSDLDEEWLPRLRVAVAATGFTLKRVDDEPKPGLIDIRMRVQIQQARFLIVELTHANLGAYWEAGYAEGLGKPVIYTCREGVDAHFDVDHSLRIEWNPQKLDEALNRLKATIRNALPDALTEAEAAQ